MERKEIGWVIVGIGLLCFSVFLWMSLRTYYIGDPNLRMAMVVSGEEVVRNAGGWLGAVVSHDLLWTLGTGAYFLVGLCGLWGVHCCMKRTDAGLWPKLFGGVALLLGVCAAIEFCAWGGLIDWAQSYIGLPHPGGHVGMISSAVLLGIAGPVGTFLFLALYLLLGALFASYGATSKALLSTGRSLVAGGEAAKQIPQTALRPAMVRLHSWLTEPWMIDEDEAIALLEREDDEGYEEENYATQEQGDEIFSMFPGLDEIEQEQEAAGFNDFECEDDVSIAAAVLAQVEHETIVADEALEEEEKNEEEVRRAKEASALAEKLATEKARQNEIAEKQKQEQITRRKELKKKRDAQIKAERAAAEIERSRKQRDPDNNEVIAAEPIHYELPPVSILEDHNSEMPDQTQALAERGTCIVETLRQFSIQCEIADVQVGPAVTCFELQLAAGIKISKILGLSDNLQMALMATSVRIIAPIPGKSTVGIEIPNESPRTVYMREVVDCDEFDSNDMHLPVALGVDATGKPLVIDLARAPHLLIAGATGTGKSVCINSMICSLLFSMLPSECKLLMVDPKMVEMSGYAGIPHMLSPVVTDMKKAAGILEWACKKMDERYELCAKVGVRDIVRFNKMPLEKRMEKLTHPKDKERCPEVMPYIVIVIDELADLMQVAGKEIEGSIMRLAQKARAVGIHCILATQRPSVDVITGVIKANLPCRIAFKVTTRIDSKTILDQNGADKLLGQGDLLYMPPTTANLSRVKGAFMSDEEIEKTVEHWTNQGTPEYSEELQEVSLGLDKSAGGGEDFQDELLDRAAEIVIEEGRGSVSFLQRKLGIGYTRSARLIEMLASQGILGEHRGAKPREVLVTPEEWNERNGGNAFEDYDPYADEDDLTEEDLDTLDTVEEVAIAEPATPMKEESHKITKIDDSDIADLETNNAESARKVQLEKPGDLDDPEEYISPTSARYGK